MARYSYTAEKSDGEIYRGSAEAPDRFALYDIIRREGGHLTHLEEEKSGLLSIAYWNATFTSVSTQDKILFARNLGSMISAGLPLARAFAVMERQTKNPRLSAAIAAIESDIRHGNTLHESIAKFPRIFPTLMCAMVRAGEEGGDLPASLLIVAEQMERADELKKKVRGALIYPCIILIAIVGIGALLMTQVVPTLASTFAEMNAELPRSTRVVIAISDFLVHHTASAVVLILALVAGMYAALHTARGRRAIDFALLHTPLIGEMVREMNAARTSRTLSSLTQSGVDILSALEIVRDVVQNAYFQDVIQRAHAAVAAGQPLSSTFLKNEQLFPPFVGEMMAVGEETGQTAEMLKRLALYYETEVDRKAKNMSTIIEPFLMVFIGAAVGFFAISMVAPIYSLSQNF